MTTLLARGTRNSGLLRIGGLIALALVIATGCNSEDVSTPSTAANPPTLPATSTTGSSSPSDEELDEPVGQVLVFGDWGSGTSPQGALAGAMSRYSEENPVHAILTTGDNFYSDDIEFLMQPMEWATSAQIPFWITWGNSDIESETRIAGVQEAFGDPPKWAVIRWGVIDVVILDSNQIASVEQTAFLASTMAASDNPMIISFHHPPYSCSGDRSQTDIIEQWISTLDDDVILVLGGHDHSYQRFIIERITYVVTGGGGRSLDPISECDESLPDRSAGAELHHFLALEQTTSSIKLTAIDVNGDPFDQVSIGIP